MYGKSVLTFNDGEGHKYPPPVSLNLQVVDAPSNGPSGRTGKRGPAVHVPPLEHVVLAPAAAKLPVWERGRWPGPSPPFGRRMQTAALPTLLIA